MPFERRYHVNVSTILQQKGEWFSTFAKLESGQFMKKLWKVLGLSFFLKEIEIEQAFISNFESGLLTAPYHGAPMFLSLAVQYLGSKTWLFIPPEDFLSDEGFRSVPAVPFLKPQRAPKNNYKMYVYHSRPGDLLFFPESWGHIVYTHPGPNMMVLVST